MRQIPEEDISCWQVGGYDAHSGFQVCDLFVKRKYGTFKEEMMNYKLELKDVKQIHLIIRKAQSFLQNSEVIKAVKARGDGSSQGEIPPYYDIQEGKPLTVEHLISILCYTDYTEHSAAFSKSFRKNDAFEGLQSIKRRNSEYFWMAKRLRETVEIYGRCSEGDGDWKERQENKLLGPFYTGVSKVINLPQFHIRLCSFRVRV